MKSLIQFFEESVEKFSNNIYLWEKPGDKYEGTTYGETKKQVYEFAAGLKCLGIRKGDRLSLDFGRTQQLGYRGTGDSVIPVP